MIFFFLPSLIDKKISPPVSCVIGLLCLIFILCQSIIQYKHCVDHFPFLVKNLTWHVLLVTHCDNVVFHRQLLQPSFLFNCVANKFNTGPKATKGSHNQGSKRIHSWFLEIEDFDQHQDQKQTKQVLRADLGLN